MVKSVGARFIEPVKNVNVIANPDLSGRGNLKGTWQSQIVSEKCPLV